MEPGDVVRQEELVPLVLDCCLEWTISPRHGAGGRTGSVHSTASGLGLRGLAVESLMLGSLSCRSA